MFSDAVAATVLLVFANVIAAAYNAPMTQSLEEKKNVEKTLNISIPPVKDPLLDELETKLSGLRSKKYKKEKDSESILTSLKDMNVKLKASGISSVGETDVVLQVSKTGNSTLQLESTGISNIGKTKLIMNTGEGDLNIPGLGHVFMHRNAILDKVAKEPTSQEVLTSASKGHLKEKKQRYN